MKTLTLTKAHDISQLHDELLAAVPTALVCVRADGVCDAVAIVESAGNEIRLTVPDDADEAAIAAVVKAHVPSVRLDPAVQRNADLAVVAEKAKLDPAFAALARLAGAG
ncbi:MAG TPA: hypothetical protein VNM48_06030 [Chloroflexota bacterium]|nr:hypothetical protein [Chloroflexota bacterium]